MDQYYTMFDEARLYSNFDLDERFTCLMCPDKVVFDWPDLAKHCEKAHFWYHGKKQDFFPKLVAAGLVSFFERRRCFSCKRCNRGIVVDFDVDDNVRVLKEHEEECPDYTSAEDSSVGEALESLRRVSSSARKMPPPPPPPRISGLQLNLPDEPGPSSRLYWPMHTMPPPPPSLPGVDIEMEIYRPRDDTDSSSRPSERFLPPPPPPPKITGLPDTDFEHPSRNSRPRFKMLLSDAQRYAASAPIGFDAVRERFASLVTSSLPSLNAAGTGEASDGVKSVVAPAPVNVSIQNPEIWRAGVGRQERIADSPSFTIAEVKSKPPPRKRQKTANTASSSRPASLCCVSTTTKLPAATRNEAATTSSRPKRVLEKPTKYSEDDGDHQSSRVKSSTPLVPATVSKSQVPTEIHPRMAAKATPGQRKRKISMTIQSGGCEKARIPTTSDQTLAVPSSKRKRHEPKAANKTNKQLQASAAVGNLRSSPGNNEDSSWRPKRKKNESDEKPLEKGKRLMEKIMESVINFISEDGRNLSDAFYKLPSRRELPDYFDIIKQPLDIAKILVKVNLRKYPSVDELENDFKLLCQNAQVYNRDDSLIFKDSVRLQTVFSDARKKWEAEAKAAAAAAAATPGEE